MILTLEQRLERLEARLAELPFWLARAHRDLPAWTFEGAPLALGAAWPTRAGVVRLEHPEVVVPATWPLEEARLELDVGGESLLQVCYDGDAESFGLDPYHQQFPLRARRFSLRLESVARLPLGVPNPEPRLRLARLVWLDVELARLQRLLELVVEAAGSLLAHEVAPGLIASAERALGALRWPSATELYLARTAGSPLFAQLWQAPGDLESHPAGLSGPERASLTLAREGLLAELGALRERHPPQGSLALSGHAHIDLAWLWPLGETRRKGRRTFASMLALMDRYPEFRFNQSSAQLYAFVEEDDPALFARVKEKAVEGQWEPVGGTWVEPDTLMPTGESLVRQLLYGQRYFKKHFGAYHRVCWLPDCFGFSPALPQLLRLAGITSFFTTKTNWNESNRFPFDLFWWEGLDGSRVLAHSFFNSADAYNAVLGPKAMVEVWGNFRGKGVHPESLLTIGYGDGGGGTTEPMLERARDLAHIPALPALRFADIGGFFDGLEQAVEGRVLPVWLGEIYLELHRGTLTSQGRTKRLHRLAERALIAAEALSGMVCLAGGETPVSLEPQWRVLLRNQFHDILPGSSIHEVYELAEQELAAVVAAGSEVVAERLEALRERLVTAGERPGVLVVNSELSPRPLRLQLDTPLPGAQAVEGGYVLCADREIPGLGVEVVLDSAAVAGLSVSERHLENELLRVDLAEDGSLERVYDKVAGREVLAGRGNQLWAFVDKPRKWDAWDIEENYLSHGEEIGGLESLTVTESGPHRVAVRLLRRFRSSTIIQDIRLWANSRRLEVKTHLDWHDRRWLLKARFPLKVRAERASYESAFGVVRRSTHQNTSWDAAQFEVAGHRFADLSEPGYGVALLNDGRYGYHARDNELGLSLLRSPIWPDPLADEGEHDFCYALYPHPGDWLSGGVLMEAEDLNRPLLSRGVRAGEERSWQALRLEGLPLGLGGLKVGEESGGLILRCYEPQGARGRVTATLPAGWRLGREVDLLERERGEPDLAFAPFQVHSWTLEREAE